MHVKKIVVCLIIGSLSLSAYGMDSQEGLPEPVARLMQMPSVIEIEFALMREQHSKDFVNSNLAQSLAGQEINAMGVLLAIQGAVIAVYGPQNTDHRMEQDAMRALLKDRNLEAFELYQTTDGFKTLENSAYKTKERAIKKIVAHEMESETWCALL